MVPAIVLDVCTLDFPPDLSSRPNGAFFRWEVLATWQLGSRKRVMRASPGISIFHWSPDSDASLKNPNPRNSGIEDLFVRFTKYFRIYLPWIWRPLRSPIVSWISFRHPQKWFRQETWCCRWGTNPASMLPRRRDRIVFVCLDVLRSPNNPEPPRIRPLEFETRLKICPPLCLPHAVHIPPAGTLLRELPTHSLVAWGSNNQSFDYIIPRGKGSLARIILFFEAIFPLFFS